MDVAPDQVETPERLIDMRGPHGKELWSAEVWLTKGIQSFRETVANGPGTRAGYAPDRHADVTSVWMKSAPLNNSGRPVWRANA